MAADRETTTPARALTDDELADEMSADSFPGSDPPSTWAGADQPGRSPQHP